VLVHEGLVHEGLVDGGRLVGGHCRSCQRPHFPELSTCPYCSSDEVERRLLSDTGVLWGWTAVTAAPPGYRGEVPFGFGVVELPEGLRIITRLTEADPAALRFGQPMRLAIVPLHVDDEGASVTTYAFEPADER
jgi:uncharacterized OB-fold protein